MHLIRYILLTLFAVIQTVCEGQKNNVTFFKRCPVKTLNLENGLISNDITGVITDAAGFTWISTLAGIQRFNGYSLEKIVPVVNKDTININYPVFLFGMKNGNFWIAYKKGILSYNADSNSFKKIIQTKNPGGFNFPIIPLKETNEGVWCFDLKKGFVIYNSSAVKTALDFADIKNVDSAFTQTNLLINNIFTANDHHIFIRDYKNKIIEINTNTHQFKYLHFTAENIFGFACNEKNLYVTSASGLSCIYIENEKLIKKVSFKKILNEDVSASFVQLTENNEILLSANKFLYEFDTACNYQKEFTDRNRNPVVSVGFIRIISPDKFRRIWLLTNDDIKRVQNINIPFEHFIYPREQNNFVRSLYFDEQKQLLLSGCFNGGIQLYDTLGNPAWQKPVSTDIVKDITSIEKLSGDDYLLITFGKGWFVLNLPSRKIKKLALPSAFSKQLQSINFINNTQRLGDSVVFIATSSNIFRCVFKEAILTSAQPLLPAGTGNTNAIDNFIYTSDNTLWIGTVNGTFYTIDKNGSLEKFHISDNYPIRSFAEDALHNIWIGTDKGLYVYVKKGILLKKFTIESGLLNDCIYAILPVAGKAAVFVSSNFGLSYVSFNGEIKNYTKQSGLQENEFNTEAAIKTLSGKFYFGGVNGISAFYPAALSQMRDTPVLNVTKLVINDFVYNSFSKIGKGDSIVLNHSQNHLQLDFAATGLLNANEYKYEYRLKGFEENSQVTNQPTGIRYVLQPGNYFFEISCSPIFSSNSIFKRTIAIIIFPPWWQTWWFTTLLIIFCVAIIVFIVYQYYYQKYLKRVRALQLQQELQYERERISRDLHDNLGAYAAAIASNVNSITNSQTVTDKTAFHHLKSNSQSIINQLNDTIWALNKEAILLTAVSDRFKIFLQKIQPNYPHINISIEENIVADKTLSPANALHLFRIMQEAVNNALRHSNCTLITIQINSEKEWNVIIKDNGTEFFDINGNLEKGNGLKNMKLRCEEAGWNISWKVAAPNGTEIKISNQ